MRRSSSVLNGSTPTAVSMRVTRIAKQSESKPEFKRGRSSVSGASLISCSRATCVNCAITSERMSTLVSASSLVHGNRGHRVGSRYRGCIFRSMRRVEGGFTRYSLREMGLEPVLSMLPNCQTPHPVCKRVVRALNRSYCDPPLLRCQARNITKIVELSLPRFDTGSLEAGCFQEQNRQACVGNLFPA